MSKHLVPHPTIYGALALALGACRSAPAPTAPASAGATTRTIDDAAAAPLDAEGRFDDVWTYLARKYDADGDGRIDAAEYGRDGTSFARLDTDADGDIDADDFETSVDPIALLTSQMMVAQYLQDDDDPKVLQQEELDAAFGAYDENFDALLTRAEFEAKSGERLALGMAPSPDVAAMWADADLFAVLGAGMDRNGDGVLDYEEVAAFHARFFPTGDVGAISGILRDAAPGGAGGPTLAAHGAMAPDFTLESLAGGTPVTLSSFRDDRPVALVFGSYT